MTLSDNDSGSALFNATGLKPGSTDTKCIQVSYTGSLASTIRLYAANTSGTNLAQYMDMTINYGTGGAAGGSCTGYTNTGAVYSGTLSNFISTYTSHATDRGYASADVARGSSPVRCA